MLGPRGLTDDRLGERFPRLLGRLDGGSTGGSGSGRGDPVRGAGPLRQRASRPGPGRVLLVGDAAGYVDALTGEGLSLGLACGRAAVGCLLAGRPEAYEQAWWRITRRYRWLTGTLLATSRRPALRRAVVPAASALPGAFTGIVNALGR